MNEPASDGQRHVIWCDACDAVHCGDRRPDLCQVCGAQLPALGRGAADLYRAYAAQLRRVVRFVAGHRTASADWADTEDVVQETFMALFRATGTIRNPKAWLVKVACRQASRAVRRQRRVIVDAISENADLLTSVAGISDAEAEQAVINSIRALPRQQKIATYLHLMEGWSRAEIAAYLNIAASTAEVHIWRGTRHLRQSMDWTPALLPAVLFAKLRDAARRIRHSIHSRPGSGAQGLASATTVHILAVIVLVGGAVIWVVKADTPVPAARTAIVQTLASRAPAPSPGTVPASPQPAPAREKTSPPPGRTTSAAAAAASPSTVATTPPSGGSSSGALSSGPPDDSVSSSDTSSTSTSTSTSSSSGVPVPDCTGISAAACASDLTQQGFTLSESPGVDSSQDPGNVDHTDPSANSVVAYGSTVWLYISGQQVPDCTGISLTDCETMLTEFGLDYDEKPDPNPTQSHNDLVDYTVPGRFTWVADGATVTEYYTFIPVAH